MGILFLLFQSAAVFVVDRAILVVVGAESPSENRILKGACMSVQKQDVSRAIMCLNDFLHIAVVVVEPAIRIDFSDGNDRTRTRNFTDFPRCGMGNGTAAVYDFCQTEFFSVFIVEVV